MLSSRTIKVFNSLKHESNRPEWKSKKLSPGQISALAHYTKLEDLVTLSRGTGSLLLDCIFKLIDKKREYNRYYCIRRTKYNTL